MVQGPLRVLQAFLPRMGEGARGDQRDQRSWRFDLADGRGSTPMRRQRRGSIG
jgi:hypothetical protein